MTDRLESDLVASIFYLKLKALIHDVRGGCYQRLTEYQKRGLPHKHMRFWLKLRLLFFSLGNVVGIISAQIPDSSIQPTLHHIVRE